MRCTDCAMELAFIGRTCKSCTIEGLCLSCYVGHQEHGCGEVMEDPPVRASDVLSQHEMTGMKSIWR